MHRSTKIATCCYCGTRAALVLDGARHELTCSACGAPLHDMKRLPKEKARLESARSELVRDGRGHPGRPAGKPAKPPKKRKKRKPFARKALEEIWDIVEDIFD